MIGSWFGIVAPHGAYRPDIDGLRALAVLAVIGFHVSPGYVPAGFIGVDIFFVISGYLITSIIVRERQAGRFRLATFYGRRVRRIFPALLLVLAATTILAWLFLPWDRLEPYGRHLAASAAFVPNFQFLGESSYFEQPLEKELLHLWSLGVEEQFYIVWPLLLLLFLKARRAAWLVAAIVFASFAYSVHLGWASPADGFYSPLSRAWELLAGALVALGMPWTIRWPQRLREVAGLAGAVLLMAGFAMVTLTSTFPGPWGLLPVGGTMLLIATGPASWLNRQLLSRRLGVGIGLISYPLYLWHWPLIAFAGVFGLGAPHVTWRASAALLSFPLAWATWRFIEHPVRGGQRGRPLLLFGLMACLCGTGLLLSQRVGEAIPRPLVDQRNTFLAHYRQQARDQDTPENLFGCGYSSSHRGIERSVLPLGCSSPGALREWFLWGDSHARSLGYGLRRNLPADVGLTQVTSSGCPPFSQNRDACTFTNERALEAIARVRPRLVILAQRERHDQRDWEALVDRIRQAGAEQVVLLGPLPQWQGDLPFIAVTSFWPDLPEFSEVSVSQDVIALDERMRRWAPPPASHYVSLVASLCRGRACRVTAPGGQPPPLMAFDYGHLTFEGSDFIARTILVPALQEIDPAPAPGGR